MNNLMILLLMNIVALRLPMAANTSDVPEVYIEATIDLMVGTTIQVTSINDTIALEGNQNFQTPTQIQSATALNNHSSEMATVEDVRKGAEHNSTNDSFPVSGNTNIDTPVTSIELHTNLLNDSVNISPTTALIQAAVRDHIYGTPIYISIPHDTHHFQGDRSREPDTVNSALPLDSILFKGSSLTGQLEDLLNHNCIQQGPEEPSLIDESGDDAAATRHSLKRLDPVKFKETNIGASIDIPMANDKRPTMCHSIKDSQNTNLQEENPRELNDVEIINIVKGVNVWELPIKRINLSKDKRPKHDTTDSVQSLESLKYDEACFVPPSDNELNNGFNSLEFNQIDEIISNEIECFAKMNDVGQTKSDSTRDLENSCNKTGSSHELDEMELEEITVWEDLTRDHFPKNINLLGFNEIYDVISMDVENFSDEKNSSQDSENALDQIGTSLELEEKELEEIKVLQAQSSENYRSMEPNSAHSVDSVVSLDLGPIDGTYAALKESSNRTSVSNDNDSVIESHNEDGIHESDIQDILDNIFVAMSRNQQHNSIEGVGESGDCASCVDLSSKNPETLVDIEPQQVKEPCGGTSQPQPHNQRIPFPLITYFIILSFLCAIVAVLFWSLLFK